MTSIRDMVLLLVTLFFTVFYFFTPGSLPRWQKPGGQ